MDFGNTDDGFLSDIYGSNGPYLSKNLFQDNCLLLKRVLGNPDPQNRALGAVILDIDQIGFLIGVLERIEKTGDLSRSGQSISYHLFDTLNILYRSVSGVEFKKNGV